jgi:hypothetical protein
MMDTPGSSATSSPPKDPQEVEAAIADASRRDSADEGPVVRRVSSVQSDDMGGLLKEFARAVIPLSLFIILYVGLIFQTWIVTPSLVCGLLCVVVGLAIFKYGLMTGFMPFGQSIGRRLPEKVHLAMFLVASACLGVLVTYSEPAIGALQLVGEILNGQAHGSGGEGAALLVMLGKRRSPQLLAAVAGGVGIAAACGLVRIKREWGIKPFIFGNVLPLLCLTWYCSHDPDISSIVGMTWDCGAVTTGPATVPIVLALGLGVASFTREKKQAQFGRRQTMTPENENSDLDGFGIVTLASLVPVLTVMLFGIMCSFSDRAAAAAHSPQGGTPDTAEAGPTSAWDEFPLRQLYASCHSVVPLSLFLVFVQFVLVKEMPASATPAELARGMAATLLGLFVFNIGLSYGSVPLGRAAGQALPEALKSKTVFSTLGLVSEEQAPLVGQVLIMLFGFAAGCMATVIDLAPCGLGETVEKLTLGEFTRMDLIVSVATGVGSGIALGFAKILFGMDLLTILVVGYSIALVLSLFVKEGMCCVAWDSAGVTSGPVTVPLVLSIGMGICESVGSADGFGILACASVCAIISVLAFSLLREHVLKHETRTERARKLLQQP